ncbi:hypothetical protein EDB81DRAFT_831537 [Dactylonectria macrodidyma]|uniref:Uncharacterized protein n=1 Tax=Dactylonectria macrodidyma TaxID=307937 RepID=A0A9P9I8U1_9HYPO|nr:hypothetical protein EDB81DRAFT_831537 [Dactylonectria macrodidyma]
MSQPDNSRQRTRPEDSSEDEGPDPTFSENATGRFRSRVQEFANKAEWISEPLYQVGEIVYLATANQQQVAGPYIIISNDIEKATYEIKRMDNGQKHPIPVSETSLKVPGP